MNTYLFAWNPNKWAWPDLQDLIKQLPSTKPTRQWKTSRTTNIGIGDNFILVKLGQNLSEHEKGIIGIGKISSNLKKDKDFLKNDEIVNYVDLEFSQLNNKPFIPLSKLKEIDPTTNWTPQNNGNQIPAYAYTKILSLLNKDQNSILFEKKIYFPIIGETIDSLLLNDKSAHRDQIVEVLIERHSSTFEKIANNSGKSVLFIAQNMVDWFSAELTKQSEIVAEWQNKYIRTKVKINGREITNYSFSSHLNQDEIIPEDIVFKEGSIKEIKVNAYERNPQARQVCLNYYGYSCQCCGFNFETAYGEIGKNFIHVHHIHPLSEIKNEYVLNPIKDLVPVCANCHAMLHRSTPPYSISEIQNMMSQQI
jgi:hypothetical protein